MTIWFTSDTHYGHANVIKYCSRPWKDAAEMDAAIIERHNKRVSKSDTVYHCGDFALMKNPANIKDVTSQLNGQIHLIIGNHDEKVLKHLIGFADVKPYKKIKLPDGKGGDQTVILFHYAMKVWDKSHYGSWNFHGHSHGSLPRDYTMKQLDVGVDCWGYAPISFEEAYVEMGRHESRQVDHHKNREIV